MKDRKDFKTQQEIWKWLAEGGEIEHIADETKVKFRYGFVGSIYFDEPHRWQKVIPKKTVKLRMYMEGNTGVWLKDGMDTYPITPYQPTNWTKEVEILNEDKE